jgi:hypothetical protein
MAAYQRLEIIMSDNRRKLIALDEEDLQVISAHCQDAVLKTGDLVYYPSEKRFALTMNRFIWEKGKRGKERRRSVLHFERVEKVSARGIDLRAKDQVLNLLAILAVEDGSEQSIELVFSADKAVRLKAECIEAQLTDMAASWEAGSRPSHPET